MYLYFWNCWHAEILGAGYNSYYCCKETGSRFIFGQCTIKGMMDDENTKAASGAEEPILE